MNFFKEMDLKLSKTYITSTAVALFCAAGAYAFLRLKYRVPRDATEVLNYLTVKIASNRKTCDEVVGELRRRIQQQRAIGFDCEWVTEQGKRHPVALLQLSSFDGFCGLFRLSHMKTMPDSLKDLLEDETVYKVGVAPIDDARYLKLDYNVDLKSTLDLRHLAVLCGREPRGLGALSKSMLNVALDKSWRIRCSDWEAEELSQRQINYAAADAHVAIKIFVKLVNEYERRSLLSWLFRRKNNDTWNNVDKFCWTYVDLHFKEKHAWKKSDGMMNGKKKETACKKRYPHAIRTKPLYHNCFLEAPDGELLCTINEAKALWYVDKKLGSLVKEDPLTVRLHFEPAGRSVGDVGKFYQMTKQNKCVVCGKTDSYIRKNVVPREYRKYLPQVMKEHSSHDVVLLCGPCHQMSNTRDRALRERLAVMCKAPVCRSDHYNENPTAKNVRMAARALLYQTKRHVLPDNRRKELEDIVLEHFPEHSKVTQELLEAAGVIQTLFENPDYEVHGLKVVEYFVQNDGLLKLEEIWREHFLTTMRPQYMPELWSVKHTEERLGVKFDEGRVTDDELKSIGPSKWRQMNVKL